MAVKVIAYDTANPGGRHQRLGRQARSVQMPSDANARVLKQWVGVSQIGRQHALSGRFTLHRGDHADLRSRVIAAPLDEPHSDAFNQITPLKNADP